MAIRCYLMKGLLGFPPPWGFDYSAGLDVLAKKLAAVTDVSVARMFGWTEWRTIVSAIQPRPANEGQVIIGHSMGANSAPSVAASFKRSVALVVGFDPTIWSYTPYVPVNVHKAICFHGTNWTNIVGHQLYEVVDPKKTKLEKYDTATLHQNIDDENFFHEIVVDAVKAAL